MINVSHHGHNRSSGFWRTFLAGNRLLKALLDFFGALQHHSVSELLDYQSRRVLVQHLVNVGHDPQIHQFFNHLTRFDSHLLGQIADRDVFRDIDVVDNFFSGLLKRVLVRLIGELLPTAPAATRHTRLDRFKIIHGKVVTTLLSARTRDTPSLQTTFTRSATQLVTGLGGIVFCRCSVQSLGLAVRFFSSTLSGLLFCLSRRLFGPRFGSRFKLQLSRLFLCFSARGSALPEQFGIISVRYRICSGCYFSNDRFRCRHLFRRLQSHVIADIGFWLGAFCILSLNVGSLLANLDVDCPLTCAAGTQRTDRLTLESNLFGGASPLTMTFFQVRKQCLLVFFRYRLIGRGMRQAGILHLREQPVHRCSHRLRQLLYCYLCHVSLPNRSVPEVLCRMNPSSGCLFLLSEPRGARSHNQLCRAFFRHFFNIQ